MFRDLHGLDECIGGFGATSPMYLHPEMYNWMIGCDASGHSVEHLEFNGMYSGFPHRIGPNAVMLVTDRLELRIGVIAT